MRVDLKPHPCSIYNFWSKWLQSNNQAAVLELDGRDPYKYFNATAANRYRFGLKNGYCASELSWGDRNLLLQEIHEVNTSLLVRQGREMKQNYKDFPLPVTLDLQCSDHYATFIGCFHRGRLVAYITTNFCGDLAAASQILGHGEHLKNGCMLVLWAEFIRICHERRIRVIVYSRWSDGTDGLKYWKRSVGMKPVILKEILPEL